MAHRLIFPAGLHGWAVPVPHDDDLPSSPPVEPVARSCLAVAGAWAFVTFEVLFLRAEGWIPATAFGGRFTAAVALCAAAGALSLLSAALYRLPAGLGGRLPFPRLAWGHFAVVNLVALVALWHLAVTPWIPALGEDRIVGLLTGLLGAAVAGLVGQAVAGLLRAPPA